MGRRGAVNALYFQWKRVKMMRRNQMEKMAKDKRKKRRTIIF